MVTLGPGILVAATGVGAGDLATGAFTGHRLGVAILWAVVLGAGIKFVLNEGLARWQLATGSTLLEGSVQHFGPLVQWCFLVYLVIWSWFVGSALMSACGVAAHAILPWFSPETDKIVYGLLHSALAIGLVRWGGYRLFEKTMSVCIVVMFVVVVFIATQLPTSWSEVLRGLCIPTIPQLRGEGIQWTVALLGGVGGTLTVLCYGYWIREEGRCDVTALRTCRIDLAVGYFMTALFGLSMVIIGSQIEVEGGGAQLIVNIADRLTSQLQQLGAPARWMFLIGAWAAIFSSLFGVWQSVPYLFSDFWSLMRGRRTPPDNLADTTAYRTYLYVLGTVPAAGLWFNFVQLQKLYAIIGALFMPALALALLDMNGRQRLVGKHRNSLITTVILLAIIAFFLVAGWYGLRGQLFG